jgi:hypothetical protein
VKWRVVHRTAYEAWREPDEAQRLALLDWMFELMNGPPADAVFDPDIGMHRATASTGNRVDMLIFPDLLPPLIAVFRIY